MSRAKKSAMKNIKTFYKSQEKVIKFFSDYSKITSKAKFRSIHWGRLKILTPN